MFDRYARVVLGCSAFVFAILLVCPTASATDWPRFRGVNEDGISPETGWDVTWPPVELWDVTVGQGYSSISVVGGRVYTIGWSGGQNTVWCLDESDGSVNWSYSYACSNGNSGYPGSRSIPTVDTLGTGEVYTLSQDGDIHCFNPTTGAVNWSRDLTTVSAWTQPPFAIGTSVTVEGNYLLLNLGSKGMCLNKSDGSTVWSSTGRGGYATPNVIDFGGERIITQFANARLVGVRVSDGLERFTYSWGTGYTIANPILVGGDKVFLSSDYSVGCALVPLASGGNLDGTATYANLSMKNHADTCVEIGGYVYGFNGYINGTTATLTCLNVNTGAQQWAQMLGSGSLIASDGKLITLTERGELRIVEASSTAYNELKGSAYNVKPLDSEDWWTAPVLSNGKIYCRSHDGSLVCLDIQSAVTPQYTLTTSVNPSGWGTVGVSPAGGPVFDENTVVTLTATPTGGYVFTGWSGDLTGTTNPDTITMTADMNVTANFATTPDITEPTLGHSPMTLTGSVSDPFVTFVMIGGVWTAVNGSQQFTSGNISVPSGGGINITADDALGNTETRTITITAP